MTEWLVRLKGHAFDLEELSEHFTSDDFNVKKDEDDYYYLRSSNFDELTDSEAVEECGRPMLERMNGAATLLFGPIYRRVEFDTVARIEDDGERYHTVGATMIISGRSRAFMKATIHDELGTADDSVPRHLRNVEALVELTGRDEKVTDALRFYERGDWFNLYKAWEVVCDAAGGMRQVVNNNWAKEDERRRFTGTAQSRGELGDEARHASERYEAPTNPMTLLEAQAFVRSAIRAWVATL